MHPLPPRHSTRMSHPPPTWMITIHCKPLPHYLIPLPPTIPYPLSSVIYYNKFSPSYKRHCHFISSNLKPKHFTKVNKLDNWKQTMTAELQALIDNHISSIIDLTPRKIPIGCKWIYKIKYNYVVCIDMYKAMLLTEGYTRR